MGRAVAGEFNPPRPSRDGSAGIYRRSRRLPQGRREDGSPVMNVGQRPTNLRAGNAREQLTRDGVARITRPRGTSQCVGLAGEQQHVVVGRRERSLLRELVGSLDGAGFADIGTRPQQRLVLRLRPPPVDGALGVGSSPSGARLRRVGGPAPVPPLQPRCAQAARAGAHSRSVRVRNYCARRRACALASRKSTCG